MLKQVKEFCAQRKIVMLDGFILTEGIPTVTVELGWQEFIQLAAELERKVIYFRAIEASIGDAIHAIEEAQQGRTSSAAESEQPARPPTSNESAALLELPAVEMVATALPLTRAHDGKIKRIFLVWVLDGVQHLGSHQTDWAEDVDAELDELIARISWAQNSLREDRRSARDARIDEFAEMLARHPRWQEATNDERRLFLAKEILPKTDSRLLDATIKQAAVYAWWHIEPQRRAEHASKVRELMAKGYGKSRISLELGISENRAAALILEAQSVKDGPL